MCDITGPSKAYLSLQRKYEALLEDYKHLVNLADSAAHAHRGRVIFHAEPIHGPDITYEQLQSKVIDGIAACQRNMNKTPRTVILGKAQMRALRGIDDWRPISREDLKGKPASFMGLAVRESEQSDYLAYTDCVKYECQAVQHSDQMVCDVCELAWDVNDPHPPECEGRGD